MIVYGLWHGGYSYAMPDPEFDLEIFRSLGAAVEAFESRYSSNGLYMESFEFCNGRGEVKVYTPTVDESSELHVFYAVTEDPDGTLSAQDMYPDRIIRFGPRRGVVVEVA